MWRFLMQYVEKATRGKHLHTSWVSCWWFMISELSTQVIHKHSVFLVFTATGYVHREAEKADLKSILNPDLSAASAPTLPRCDAASTSALLLGPRPTNPFTPWKHKQIDTLRREPDNPSFHLHSRLSSITGILSLVSSLVARQTNRGLDPRLSS